MDCSEIQFMVLFVYSHLRISLFDMGGDTMRHKDDAWMDMVMGKIRF